MAPKKKGKKETSSSNLCKVPDDATCIFCLSSEDKEEEYGKFIKKCGLQVHYFCMLFASGLCQRGKTEEHGILGFLPEDIIKEIRRGARLRCSYCKTMGSTIGCVISSCSRKFHLGCGRKNGTLHQFFGSFRSFCPEHRPRQMVPISDRLAFYGTANAPCAICMNTLEARASNDTLRSPCCRNSWFHRTCIQKHASTAGLYFFKCPLCNNKEMFQNEMLEYGIYIPDQDAAWETEPNAYNELMERYLQCDAVLCRCPHGRKYNRDGGKWEIMTCDWCGSKGTHEACHSLVKISRNLVCLECKEIDEKSKKQRKEEKRKITPLKKRLNTSLEKIETVDLEEKAKSEYPGPSTTLVKPVNQTPVMSPGMILRLSYQETDDDVDVVEEDACPPQTSSTKKKSATQGRRRGRSRHRKRSRSSSSEYIPLSSCPPQTSSTKKKSAIQGRHRGRSRQRKRSRSSSSEYIPLSSVRNRLRSASRGAHRARSQSRSSSESPIHARLRSASRKRSDRSRSSSLETFSTSRLRSTSRGRKRRRSRSSSEEMNIRKRLRSASRGRPTVPPAGIEKCNGRYTKSPAQKTDAYDEVDGLIVSQKKKKRRSSNHPFSSENYKKTKKKKKPISKMLISMEPDLSDLSPLAQYPFDPVNEGHTGPLNGITSVDSSKVNQFLETNQKEGNGVTLKDINSELCGKLSPQKPKRKYQKKKLKVDSKQTLINHWLKTGQKSNKENKYLTIEYHGKRFVKLLGNRNELQMSPKIKAAEQQSSPNTRSSVLKSNRQPSPSVRSSPIAIDSDPCTISSPIHIHIHPSPTTRSSSLKGTPLSCITFSPVLCETGQKTASVVKEYPLRSTPKQENGRSSLTNKQENVRCSLTNKFVENSTLDSSDFPFIRSLLAGKDPSVKPTENINSSGSSSDTLDYMDDDFLTSEESDNKSERNSTYIIKKYENMPGLEQVVLPTS